MQEPNERGRPCCCRAVARAPVLPMAQVVGLRHAWQRKELGHTLQFMIALLLLSLLLSCHCAYATEERLRPTQWMQSGPNIGFGSFVAEGSDEYLLVGANPAQNPRELAYIFAPASFNPGWNKASFASSGMLSPDTSMPSNISSAKYVQMLGKRVWTQLAALKLKTADIVGNSNLYFGSSGAFVGHTAIVGSYGAEAAYVFSASSTGSGGSGSGATWGTVWDMRAKLIPKGNVSAFEDFGWSVVASTRQDADPSSILAVSAVSADSARGAVYTYGYSHVTAAWSQQARLTISGASAGYRFGYSVAATAEVLVVGAIGAQNSRGSVFVFSHMSTSAGHWSAPVELTISSSAGGAVGDEFGCAVSILPDADTKPLMTRLAVGARGKGAVFIFEQQYQGGAWLLSTTLLPTDAATSASAGRRFGHSLSSCEYSADDAVGLLVGSPALAPGASAAKGTSYLFTFEGNGSISTQQWEEYSPLIAQDPGPGLSQSSARGFGSAVTLSSSGSYAFIVGNRSTGSAGNVFIYRDKYSHIAIERITRSPSFELNFLIVGLILAATCIVCVVLAMTLHRARRETYKSAEYAAKKKAKGGLANRSGDSSSKTDYDYSHNSSGASTLREPAGASMNAPWKLAASPALRPLTPSLALDLESGRKLISNSWEEESPTEAAGRPLDPQEREAEAEAEAEEDAVVAFDSSAPPSPRLLVSPFSIGNVIAGSGSGSESRSSGSSSKDRGADAAATEGGRPGSGSGALIAPRKRSSDRLQNGTEQDTLLQKEGGDDAIATATATADATPTSTSSPQDAFTRLLAANQAMVHRGSRGLGEEEMEMLHIESGVGAAAAAAAGTTFIRHASIVRPASDTGESNFIDELACKNVLAFGLGELMFSIGASSVFNASALLYTAFLVLRSNAWPGVVIIVSACGGCVGPWLLIYMEIMYPRKLGRSLSLRTTAYHFKPPFRMYHAVLAASLLCCLDCIRFLPWRQSRFSVLSRGFPTRTMWTLVVRAILLHNCVVFLCALLVPCKLLQLTDNLRENEVGPFHLVAYLTLAFSAMRLLQVVWTLAWPVWMLGRFWSNIELVTSPVKNSSSAAAAGAPFEYDMHNSPRESNSNSGIDNEEGGAAMDYYDNDSDRFPTPRPANLLRGSGSGSGGGGGGGSAGGGGGKPFNTYDQPTSMVPLITMPPAGSKRQAAAAAAAAGGSRFTARSEFDDGGDGDDSSLPYFALETSPIKRSQLRNSPRGEGGGGGKFRLRKGTFHETDGNSSVSGVNSLAGSSDSGSRDTDAISVTSQERAAMIKLVRSNSDNTLATTDTTFTISPASGLRFGLSGAAGGGSASYGSSYKNSNSKARPVIPKLDFSKLSLNQPAVTVYEEAGGTYVSEVAGLNLPLVSSLPSSSSVISPSGKMRDIRNLRGQQRQQQQDQQLRQKIGNALSSSAASVSSAEGSASAGSGSAASTRAFQASDRGGEIQGQGQGRGQVAVPSLPLLRSTTMPAPSSNSSVGSASAVQRGLGKGGGNGRGNGDSGGDSSSGSGSDEGEGEGEGAGGDTASGAVRAEAAANSVRIRTAKSSREINRPRKG